MNFHLAALDDRDREPGDTPSIGLILCREHKRFAGEALNGRKTACPSLPGGLRQ
jgi:hypothetical protein